MIYYIYKVRRKQTSIRSSRSALPHRYLRSISWISWKGISPLQAGFPPVLHTEPRSAVFSRRCLHPRPRWLRSYCHPEEKENIYWSFLRKRKTSVFPFSRAAPTQRSSRAAMSAILRAPPATHPRPVHRPPITRSCGLPINKKCGPAALRREPAHHVCQTCSKKRRLLAQEKHT